MGIGFESTGKFEGGEVIYARARSTIEIESSRSAGARRECASRQNGRLFYDNATASEIVLQTERLLQPAAQGRSF